MGQVSVPGFVPGRLLSERLFREHVQPTLTDHFPDLRFAAGLFGPGSDVLGFDSPRSMDHDWGPRVQIVIDEDQPAVVSSVLAVLEQSLPDEVAGVATRWVPGSDFPVGDLKRSEAAPRQHGVVVLSIEEMLEQVLGTPEPIQSWSATRWLTTPRQSLLEFTSGLVLRDDQGVLTALREAAAWYPDDVWLYVMSGRWQRIAQVEAFIGRTAEAGDDRGSRRIAAGVVADIMQLALLQRRQWAPYPKWLGTAFSRSEPEPALSDLLDAVLSADSARVRMEALVDCLLELSRRHDDLHLTAPMKSRRQSFFTRPYPVIWCEHIARALHQAISDQRLRGAPFGLGGIDEITDSTDALKNRSLRHALSGLWEGSHKDSESTAIN